MPTRTSYFIDISALSNIGGAAGDTFYYNGTNVIRLAKGTSGQFYKQGASSPSWANIVESDVTNLVTDLAATEKTVNKGAVSGYAGLNASQQLTNALNAVSQIPAGTVGQVLTTIAGPATAWAAGFPSKVGVFTLGADGTTLSCTSLAAYDAYIIYAVLKLGSANSGINLLINNDSGSNYSVQILNFSSTTVATSSTSSDTKAQLLSTGDNFANDLCIIWGIIYNRKIGVDFHLGQIHATVQRAGVASSAIHSHITDIKHNQASDLSRIDFVSTVGNLLQNSVVLIAGITLA